MASDKTILINSMNNLINHISASPANQEEIFRSLTRKDFEKIITNLEDPVPRLRLTTAILLGQLLHGNSLLQAEFCQLMSLPELPGSRVVLNGNMGKLLQKNPHKVLHIFRILKQHGPQDVPNSNALIWYVNPAEALPKVSYLCKEDLQAKIAELDTLGASTSISLSSSFSTRGENEAPTLFDPLDCIIGMHYLPSHFASLNQRTFTSESMEVLAADQKKSAQTGREPAQRPKVIRVIPGTSLTPQPMTNFSVFAKYQNSPATLQMNLQQSEHSHSKSYHQNSIEDSPMGKNSQMNKYYVPQHKYSVPSAPKFVQPEVRKESSRNNSDYAFGKYQNTSFGPTSTHAQSVSYPQREGEEFMPPTLKIEQKTPNERAERMSMPYHAPPGIHMMNRYSYAANRAPMTDRYIPKKTTPSSSSINEKKKKMEYEAERGTSSTLENPTPPQAAKVKTITLGGRGCETARERKPIKMSLNWQ